MLERWRPAAWLLREHDVWDGERAYADFGAACRAHAGRRCRVWVSSTLLAELACDADLPLADDAAAIDWARGVLQHYHGQVALGWSLAAWQAGLRRGVSALREPALADVRATADASAVRLLSVAPWWSAVLARALRSVPALRGATARLLVVEGPCITAIELERGALTGLQLRRLDAAIAGVLQDWCAELPPRSTVVVGYGIEGDASTTGLVAGADWLAAAAPPSQWLAGIPA